MIALDAINARFGSQCLTTRGRGTTERARLVYEAWQQVAKLHHLLGRFCQSNGLTISINAEGTTEDMGRPR